MPPYVCCTASLFLFPLTSFCFRNYNHDPALFNYALWLLCLTDFLRRRRQTRLQSCVFAAIDNLSRHSLYLTEDRPYVLVLCNKQPRCPAHGAAWTPAPARSRNRLFSCSLLLARAFPSTQQPGWLIIRTAECLPGPKKSTEQHQSSSSIGKRADADHPVSFPPQHYCSSGIVFFFSACS